MKCFFLRHGIAVDAEESRGPEFDRPLTAPGRERMELEAKTISKLHLELEVIVTSPLVRARQTAEIVAGGLKMQDRLVEDKRVGLGFNLNQFASVLQSNKDATAIMLVGHEPSMSQTISQLIGGGRLDFKKGSLACVNVTDTATPAGELVWLAAPKLLVRS